MSDNKLGITNQAESATAEERISRACVKRLYDSGDINDLEVGKHNGLSTVH